MKPASLLAWICERFGCDGSGDESGEPLEDGEHHQARLKRPRRNMSIGCLVWPSQARSARTSPMTEANLKPCPEHGLAMITFG